MSTTTRPEVAIEYSMSEEVLLYRAPGCHAGDLQKRRHVNSKAISDAIVLADARRSNALFVSVKSLTFLEQVVVALGCAA